MKFCESCGAKIESVPACPKCGALLAPGVKFCETCGAPVSPVAAPAAPATATTVLSPLSAVPDTPGVPETQPLAELPEKAEEKGAPVPGEKKAPLKTPAKGKKKSVSGSGEKTVLPESPVKVEEKTLPAPEEKPIPPEPLVKAEEKPAPSPVIAKEIFPTDTAREVPKEISPKKPIPQRTMIIAGIIILALLGAIVYFVVLPMMSGSVSAQTGGNTQSLPGLPSGTVNPTGTQSSVPSTGTSASQVSFVVEPTQVPPANLLVTFQAERDPITGLVTITFTGGAGRNGIKNVDIELSRSDGQVVTRTVTLTDIGDGLTLEGTKTGDDHIEVTANYNNGEHYRIIDKILEYKRRNW
jgi:hypothetical protein